MLYSYKLHALIYVIVIVTCIGYIRINNYPMNHNYIPHRFLVVACLLIALTAFNTKIFGQCAINTIPDDSIFCGNAIKLRVDIPWNTTSTTAPGLLNALYFINNDSGYAAGEGGAVLETTNGGASWSIKTTPSTGTLNDIQFVNDSIGFTAGGSWASGGVFLKTQNRGETWVASNPVLGNGQTIKSLYFLNKDTGLVVGGDDLNMNCFILKTTNGGNTWLTVFTDSTYLLKKIIFVNKNIGFASASNGTLLKTTDGGLNWLVIYTNTVYQFTKLVFTTALHGYSVATGNGDIYFGETKNGGQTWSYTPQSSLGILGSNDLRDIYFEDSLTGYLLSSYTIYKTTDAGLTWSYYNQGPGSGVVTYFMKTPRTLYATRAIGAPTKISALHFPVSYHWWPSVYLSDSIAAEPTVSPNTTTTYYVKATYKNNCIAYDTVSVKVNPLWAGVTKFSTTINCGYATPLTSVTSYNNIIPLNYRWSPADRLDSSTVAEPHASPHSTTRYYLNVSTFNYCATPDSNDMSIEVQVNPLLVNAGADKTLICGDSIKVVPQQPWLVQSTYPRQFNKVWFTGVDTAFAIGGGISKSVDGGKTWIEVLQSTTLNALHFVNKNIGYVVGEYGLCLKTINAGSSWQNYGVTNSPSIRAVWFTSADTGYVASSNGVIRKTTNGAVSWSFQASNTTEQLNALYFINSLTGFAIGNNGVLRKTNNGGATWITILVGTTQHLKAITFVTANVGFITASGNVLLKTIDGGLTWSIQNATGIYEPSGICFTSLTTGYISGSIAATSAIATTNDGGLSWVLQPYGFSNITSLYALNEQHVYALAFTNLLVLPPVPSSYTWKNLNINQTHTADYFRPSQTTSYAVSYNLNGCIASDTLGIQVNPFQLSVYPNFAFDINLVCGNLYKPDSVIVNLPWSLLTYAWDSAIGLNNRFDLLTEMRLRETKRYTLRAQTSNGCYTHDSIYVMVQPFKIQLPTHAITEHQNICGTNIKLDSVTTNSPEALINYLWKPGAHLSDSLVQNPTLTVFNINKYVLQAVTASGCKASDSLEINPRPLEVFAGNDKYAFCGTQTTLDSLVINQSTDTVQGIYLHYKWQPQTGLNNDTILNPSSLKTNITYKITVTNNAGCTVSDSVKIIAANLPNAPLCIVTVNEQNKNVLVWEKHPSWPIDTVVIQKETNVTEQYTTLSKYAYKSFSTFVDSFSNALVQANLYRLQFIDSCGLYSAYGLPHKTMHLTINKGMGNSWNLLWNSYEGFTPNTYNIYRGTDSLSLSLIGTASGSNNSYTDLNAPGGNFYYQVEITSPYSCNPSKVWGSSRSNYISTLYSGVNETYLSKIFMLYPNPIKNEFTINWSSNDDFVNVMVYNLQGAKVHAVNLSKTNDVVKLNDVPNGIYLVVMSTENSLWRQLIVKEE